MRRATGRVKVLHFTKIINRNDFIDVIIRHADSSRFFMMASSYRGQSNIENPAFEEINVPFFSLDIDHGWADMFRGAWRLSKILKKEQVDILHTHHYYEAVMGRMACLLHPRTAHIIGRHYHDQFYLTTTGLKLKFYLLVENIINRLSSAIIVPSTLIVELLKKQGVSADKIKFIPYCFDFKARRYARINEKEVKQKKNTLGWEDRFVIGNLARHHDIKGQTYLLKAFKNLLTKIPRVVLVMVGDGPSHEKLKKEAKELDILDSVFFLGWRKDGHELINTFDLIVHPTLQEAFPQIMIEAMALEKPIVITPVSGATDVIQDHINGFFIPFKSVDGIESAVEEIYLNPNKAKAIAKNGFEFVTTHFTIQNIIPQFETVYENVNADK